MRIGLQLDPRRQAGERVARRRHAERAVLDVDEALEREDPAPIRSRARRPRSVPVTLVTWLVKPWTSPRLIGEST